MKESYPSISLCIALSHIVPPKSRRKCPGTVCGHIQAQTGLQMQLGDSKAPQKECPSCSRSTYYQQLHYILECEMTHNHFVPHMDVNDPGALKEAAPRVKVTMKDQQAQTTFMADHPVPRYCDTYHKCLKCHLQVSFTL